MSLSLGFSPCPNDTFLFGHLVGRRNREQPSFFREPLLEDVETLNRWAFSGRLDVTKLSFHALGHLLDDYCVLPTGSALGRGCGPLLVAASELPVSSLAQETIAIPGRFTTAALLLKLFLPGCRRLTEMSFERIMPAIAAGEVSAGVIIHESRFTYRRFGLVCLQDLGDWWENTSGLPIPLGCIAARRSLGPALLEEIDRRVRTSLLHARARPGECLDYIRRYAQETEDEVIRQHIELYVNSYTLDLGDDGREAVRAFLRRGRESGVLPTNAKSPFCFGETAR